MKPHHIALLGVLLTPAFHAVAAVDVKSLAQEAADNTFKGQSYSWSTVTTRPDGEAETISGQADHGTFAISIQDDSDLHSLIIVGDQRFILTENGWRRAWGDGPRHGGKPPAGMPPGSPPDGTPPPDTLPEGTLPPGMPPFAQPPGSLAGGREQGAPTPERMIDELISRASSWTSSGDTLVGQLVAPTPPASNTSAPAVQSPTGSGVVTLWVQGGQLSKADVASTFSRPSATGASVTKTEEVATTFSAVGTTAIVLPAEVKALIAAGTK